MEQLIKTYKNYLSLTCSGKTIERYSSLVINFLQSIEDPNNVSYDQVLKYVCSYKSIAARKQAQGALKHFYKGVVYKPELVVRLPKIKMKSKLPQILIPQEIQDLLSEISNIKHKAIIHILYYGALRVSEVTNLKIIHVNGASKNFNIEFTKGAKSRLVPFSHETLLLLRKYYKAYQPTIYLFNGQGGLKYSPKSIRAILNNSLIKAGIFKKVTPHGLRHSRATHLLANGVDVKIVKELLGHSKISTTERYLHLTTHNIQESMLQADLKIKYNIQNAN